MIAVAFKQATEETCVNARVNEALAILGLTGNKDADDLRHTPALYSLLAISLMTPSTWDRQTADRYATSTLTLVVPALNEALTLHSPHFSCHTLVQEPLLCALAMPYLPHGGLDTANVMQHTSNKGMIVAALGIHSAFERFNASPAPDFREFEDMDLQTQLFTELHALRLAREALGPHAGPQDHIAAMNAVRRYIPVMARVQSAASCAFHDTLARLEETPFMAAAAGRLGPGVVAIGARPRV